MADNLSNQPQPPPLDDVVSITSNDVIVEILSRLPIKTLTQFLCVCKSWRALIFSSHFAMKHLSRSNPSMRLLFLPPEKRARTPPKSMDYKALLSLNKEDHNCNSTLESSLRDHDLPGVLFGDEYCSTIRIVGSCNGLICLKLEGNDYYWGILLWNPLTRETNMLPKPRSCTFPSDPMFYGFGYDSATKDYKVVLGTKSITSTRADATKIAVFTLKAGSWKIVEDTNCVQFKGWRRPGHGCVLNGALHWLDYFDFSRHSRPILSTSKIISFDLAEEKFHELMLLPSDGLNLMNFINGLIQIGTMGGCLFLSSCNSRALTIWMMKEYGVKESWTMVIKIPSSWAPFPHDVLGMIKPIFFSENIGEILMIWCRNNLVLYNLKEGTSEIVLKMTTEDSYLMIEAILYVETFAPPILADRG